MSQADNMRFVTLLTFVFGSLLIENDENNDTCIKKTYCPSCSQGKFKRPYTHNGQKKKDKKTNNDPQNTENKKLSNTTLTKGRG